MSLKQPKNIELQDSTVLTVDFDSNNRVVSILCGSQYLGGRNRALLENDDYQVLLSLIENKMIISSEQLVYKVREWIRDRLNMALN